VVVNGFLSLGPFSAGGLQFAVKPGGLGVLVAVAMKGQAVFGFRWAAKEGIMNKHSSKQQTGGIKNYDQDLLSGSPHE
jgi:hypothetical protein